METITYTSKDLDGLVEKQATGISDAQAVQKLLDAYSQNKKLLQSAIEVTADMKTFCTEKEQECQLLRDYIVDTLIDRVEYLLDGSLSDSSLAAILTMPSKQIIDALQHANIMDWVESMSLEKSEAW